MGNVLFDPLRAATHRYVLKDNRPPVPLLPAQLGGDAGAIGAAWALQVYGGS